MTARTLSPAPAPEKLSTEDHAKLATDELAAFLRLLEQLEADDWTKPSPCTLWNVREVVAHQAGHIQAGRGLFGLLAQSNPLALRAYRKRGMNMLDAMNQKQVDMRASSSPGTLIKEIREGTPNSIAARSRLNPLSARFRVPVHPVGMMPVRKLLDVVFPRDMWIHRLDIADATGKPFTTTAAHDGRLVALAVADTADVFARKAPGLGVELRLQGPAGGEWGFGNGTEPRVTLEMSVEDFLRRSSERITVDTALERVSSNAPQATTRRVLEHLIAPY
jgi:uncharacterized protein (TIGR03083 family)